ncbi:MAG: hypothetical protein E7677_01245 [Ruminococcaceae bacterium]|nr:hypothetical protein [Oscillospiraceae bacterium]
MSENRFPCSCTDKAPQKSETVCIDTNRVLDSCRDRDCFEDVKVLLTSFGNDILEHTTNIRAKSAKISWTQILIDPIKFNRGFYSVTIKFYVSIGFEACLCGGRSQEFEGIAVLEKKVILYGSESNVSVFKSQNDCNDFCSTPDPCYSAKNVPTAIVEAVDPIILNVKVREPEDTCCCCCCCCGDIPQGIMNSMNDQLSDSNGRFLTVSLGIFSVVRLVRPAQYLIHATEYCVPDKVCVSTEDDNPCSVFRNMAFPTAEFCPPDFTPHQGGDKHGKCGCGN